MKMNKFIASTAILPALAMLLSGCIKEVFPEGGSVTVTQKKETINFEDPVAAMSTVLISNQISGFYEAHLNFAYPSLFGAYDRATGEVIPVSQNVAGGNQYYDRWQAWHYPESTGLAPNGWPTRFVYENYYRFIAVSNEIIALLKDDATKSEAYGAAKVFRANAYLDMARLYDPLPAKAPEKPSYETDVLKVQGLTVPLSKEGMAISDFENNPRMTREQIFKFIFEDLDSAEQLLANYRPALKNAPSLAVVYGLKARAYLWLGGFTDGTGSIPNGEAAYRKAAEYARKAITASGATMMTEAQWTDPKTGFNTDVPSWMWTMIQSKGTVINNLTSWTAHMAPDALYGYGSGSQPGIPIENYRRIAEGDFRKKLIVRPYVWNSSNPSERTDMYAAYAEIAPYINLSRAEFGNENDANGNPLANSIIAPLTFFKFKPNGGEIADDVIGNATTIPMMRIEEMMLIEAEATAHYDAGTGKTLLETFMANRAANYTVPDLVDLVDEIVFQKRIELWGEGLVIYDMKRLNIGIRNGEEGTNAPSGARISSNGRLPWWNLTIPLGTVQQNAALRDKNNPDPTQTLKSVD
jgi:hypothetical protein